MNVRPGLCFYRSFFFCLLCGDLVSAAPIPGLNNTGRATNGTLLATGAVDPAWRMVQSADLSTPGPNAIVVNDTLFPIVAGPWLASGPNSKWIGPMANQSSGSAAGDYRYRITFDLAGLEPATAVITLRLSSDNATTAVLLNGANTGITYDGNFGAFSAVMTINSGFIDGTNMLDVVVNNASTTANPTAFRCEISGTADLIPPPGTPPSIVVQPVGQTNGLGESATFNVSATGSRPLSYQWRFGSNNVANATNTSFTINGLAASNTGLYQVIVSNASGSVTSSPAMLSVVFLSPAQLSYEPIGPSSRRTGLAFSEILYHPKDRTDGLNLEFIEIYNSNPFAEDVGGYRISGDVDFTFPNGTSIPGLSYVVVAPRPQDVQAAYGLAGVFGPLTNATSLADGGANVLPNDSGTIRLRKRSGGVILEVSYSDGPPWPAAADGAGPSMILARPSYSERSARAWAASAFLGGSPGTADPVPAGLLENVVINEILAHTDDPARDYVELHNHSSLPVDLSGCYLTDERNTNHFRIPDGITLPPGGFISYDQDQLGFALSASGETVYFINPGQTRVLDALRFGGQANGVAFGRYPDGAPEFQELMAQTPGTTNAPPLVRDIVINEIMYHPISEDDDDEFVELHNRGLLPVNVGGWQFTDGISFAFPPDTMIPAGGFLVVAKNTARILTNYPGLSSASVVGNYGGALANGGERLALARPDYGFTTNGNVITTNVFYVVVDEVTYVDGGRWGKWSDGGGSSLELIDARSDNRLGPNWADSDETAKSQWTSFEHTGVLDLGHPSVTAIDQLHFFLMGAGEALVDDLEVVSSAVNRVSNAGFESGTNGWIFRGTQRPSYATNGGFSGANALRLVATSRGDVVNRVQTTLTATLGAGSTATLRAKARWLRGHPELLMRVVGNSLEAVGSLPVPRNLGTPGAANSRAVPNAGPAITEVTHRPILPKAGQNVRVTARVQDTAGVGGVSLIYRVDPSATTNTVLMADDGINGDSLAGDGIYTGIIPGQNSGVIVAFRVRAADGFVPPASAQFPADAPVRECLVRFGESVPPGAFSTYRIWMTQATFNFWSAREPSANEDVDTTFAYGDTRVVYNVGTHYGSSENYSTILTTPTGTLVGYNMSFPEDEPLLGASGVRLDFPNRDTTYLREVAMYWLLDQYGLPNHYRRFIHLHINGVRRATIFNDTQRPNGDSVEQWYPDDSEGELFKLNPWYEATNSTAAIFTGAFVAPQLVNTTTGGATKTAYYRFAWLPRAINGSANNYSNLFAMITAANAPSNGYQSAVECVVDIPQWMRTFAMNDLASYWDAFGNPNSKNSYLYRPERSGWKIMCWDFDVGLGTGNGGGQIQERPTAALFDTSDPGLQRMSSTPFIVRQYWAALDEAVYSFFQPASVQTFLADRYAAFQAAGIDTVSPFVPSGTVPTGEPQRSIPDWITARRNFLLTHLNTVSNVFSVTGTNFITTGTNLVVLTGTAPVRVQTIAVNGVAYTPVWTTVNAWRLLIPVTMGTNALNISGLDRLGSTVSNITRTVHYTGADELAEDNVVINEIMYNPLTSDATFVELFNRSTNFSFDLSGWRLSGIDFTFPPGTIITNRGFLVVSKDRAAFGATFGWGIPILGKFDGQLDDGGETLTLIKPGATPALDLVVDRVTYDDDPPWPQAADGLGSSLQVIDPMQDNARVGNWAGGADWKFFSYTGNPGSAVASRLSFLATNFATDLYLDDVALVVGTVAGEGTNLLANPGFEAPTLGPWRADGLGTNSHLTTEVAHSGAQSAHLVFATGTPQLTNFFQELTNVIPAVLMTNTPHTLSFWYLAGTNSVLLRARVNSFYTTALGTRPVLATPGTTNSVAGTLAAFPLLWLSEVQPENLTGPVDNFTEREPWIELHNSGASPIPLDGCFLANGFSNLTQWAFPPGAVIQPGQFLLVWADGEAEETAGTNLHTSFRLAAGTGTVVLSRLSAGSGQILDYLNYRGLAPDRSFGSHPPPQLSTRREFFVVTPRGANNPAGPPVQLFINEWMAANSGFFADPMDGDSDDWFEIYNPGANRVDLSGWRLTDNLASPNKFIVPTNISVPPQGFLLVWADEESGQTRTNGDLHVNFKLSQSGEAIALYSPQGVLIDAVNFGQQTNNVSQGRFPDGGPGPFPYMNTPTPRAPNTVATPAIEILSVMQNGPVITLTWSAQAGGSYRVQFKTELSDPTWSDLPGDVTAAGATAAKSDTNNGTQRFYRVQRVF